VSDRSRGYQQLFAELKRRHVFKVATVYGVVAFGLIQVADPLVGALGLSEAFLTYVVAALLLGFPVALVLAWAFEVTPQGVQKTEAATPEEIEAIVAEPAARRWVSGLLALAGVVLLFGGGWWIGRQGSEPAPDLSATEAPAEGSRTIALLPFDNLGDDENRVLASGLYNAVQTQLVKLADLTVVSAHDYESSETTIAKIAGELGVQNVLQASVQQVGDNVLVTVGLIDARTSKILWGDEFNEGITPDNLFDIQSGIARSVAQQLKAQLSPADLERLESGYSTDDMEALNLYYRAMGMGYRDVTEQVRLFEQAVELDPGFVEAWQQLAQRRSVLVYLGEGGEEGARAALERTETLAPGGPEALSARGMYLLAVEDDEAGALEQFRRAEKLAPSDASLKRNIAWTLRDLGRSREAAQTMRQALSLSPQDPDYLGQLVGILYGLARWDAAYVVNERRLAVDPRGTGGQINKVELAFAIDRDPRRARRFADEFALDPTEDWFEGWQLAWLAIYERDYEEARQALAAMPTDLEASYEANRLNVAARVEELRDGDPEPLLDQLRTLFARESMAGRFPMLQGSTLVLSGDEEAGFALLAEGVEQARTDGNAGALWFAATNYAQLGRANEALDLLEEAVGRPTVEWRYLVNLASLENGPWYDEVRDDPRFVEIMRRQREYEEEQAREADEEGPWLP
jgi:TolB-like protein